MDILNFWTEKGPRRRQKVTAYPESILVGGTLFSTLSLSTGGACNRLICSYLLNSERLTFGQVTGPGWPVRKAGDSQKKFLDAEQMENSRAARRTV